MSQAVLQIRKGLPHTLTVQIKDADGAAIPDLSDVEATLRSATGTAVSAPDNYWPRAMAQVVATPGTYTAQLTSALVIVEGGRYRARVTCTVSGEAITVEFAMEGVSAV